MAKRGSNVKEQCPICGKVMTRAGLIGHLRFKHHRDHKAPLMPVQSKPYITRLEGKALVYDSFIAKLADEFSNAFDKGDHEHLVTVHLPPGVSIKAIEEDLKAEVIRRRKAAQKGARVAEKATDEAELTKAVAKALEHEEAKRKAELDQFTKAIEKALKES
jgi:hypothetical protein